MNNKMKNKIKIWFLASLLIAFSFIAKAADYKDKVGVNERLGASIPQNISFYDSNGNKVLLGELIKKPTIIDFAYYRCKGICTPLMSELADVVNKVDLQPGKDYNIISISFNPNETIKDAADKKVQMMNLLNTNISDSGWKFLIGDSAAIKAVTDSAGFNFEREGDAFLHSGVLIFVSSQGKICRYLKPDYDYKGNFKILPFDFKMAIIEASKGEEIPVVEQALKYCFTYQPKNQNYVFDAFKISGIGVILGVLIIFIFVVRKPKKTFAKNNYMQSKLNKMV
jgi:protein SCO1/2